MQHRMAYQGEYFVERYEAGAAAALAKMCKGLDHSSIICSRRLR